MAPQLPEDPAASGLKVPKPIPWDAPWSEQGVIISAGRGNNIPQQGMEVERCFCCRFDLGFLEQQRTQG